MRIFSQLLREARAAKRLTFEQLAAEVGYHSTYLSLVERGRRRLDEQGVVRVAQVLGIDPVSALLAAVRERLPENLRAIVPSDASPTDPEHILAAARQLQAEQFEYEIEDLQVAAVVDWDGNLRIVRLFEGVRPNAAGRRVWEISFRERVLGVEPSPEQPLPKFAVREKPADLLYELTSATSEMWQTHRLFFPTGWRRSPHREQDAFCFAFETYQREVYLLDASSFVGRAVTESIRHPFRGFFSFYLPYFVRRLRVGFDFPRGYEPERWEGWAWWGTVALDGVARNLAGKGVSRSLTFRSEGAHAELVADEPLAGYTFALVWTPADRQRYLEARYGDADENAPRQDLDCSLARDPSRRPSDGGSRLRSR